MGLFDQKATAKSPAFSLTSSSGLPQKEDGKMIASKEMFGPSSTQLNIGGLNLDGMKATGTGEAKSKSE